MPPTPTRGAPAPGPGAEPHEHKLPEKNPANSVISLAGAALDAVLGIADEVLGLHRVQASVLVHNGPSRAVLRRAGFEEIGLARSYLKIAGRWQDHILCQRILP